jgi:putative peptide zinc metalloprotease protein
VPAIGFGLIIFFPVLYCDTTDAWRLADRKQRMAISAAGILSEAALAVIGVYVWAYTAPGLVNSLAFHVMTYSLLSTILFNGNPLMKFDGYFVLMDYLQKPNLAGRGSAHVKYLWMNGVLGLSQWEDPATDWNEALLYSSYGISAFIYRFFLVTGIVAGVYYRFDKTLGLFLAGLAAVIMIFMPLFKGSRTILNNRGRIRPRFMGSFLFFFLLVLLFAALVVPWSGKTIYSCYMDSAKIQKLTVPLLTKVEEVLMHVGDPADNGRLLYKLDPTDLQIALHKAATARDVMKGEVEMLRLDDALKAKAGGKEIELKQKQSEVDKIKADLEKAGTGFHAPFQGTITKLDPRMQEGFQPGEGTIVGEFKSLREGAIRVLVPERDIEKIRVGQNVVVWFPLGTGLELDATIDEVSGHSVRDLTGTPFSSSVGGEIATEQVSVEEKGGGTAAKGDKSAGGGKVREVPLEAHYLGSIFVNNEDLKVPLGMTGRIVVPEPPRSLLSRMVRAAARTLNIESLF